MKQASDMQHRSIKDEYECLLNTYIPKLKRELSDSELRATALEDEVANLKSDLKSRDEEILRLKTEIHKLKVSIKPLLYLQ